jgi:hypothetical protein
MLGQIFGQLTVVARAPRVGGRDAWQCQCTCGQPRVVRQDRLRSGNTTSCGCARRQADTMVGRTFGHLTVVAPAAPVQRHARWQCRCRCGRLTTVYGYALRNGNTTACGCNGGRRVAPAAPAPAPPHPLARFLPRLVRRTRPCRGCGTLQPFVLETGGRPTVALLCPACLRTRVQAVVDARDGVERRGTWSRQKERA